MTATPADPDGDQLTLSWRAKYGTVNSSGPTATTATYVATSGWGRDTIFVTVSDGHGGSAEGTAGVYIRNLNTPTIALFPVAPTNPNCPGFALQVTPTEDLLVTAFHIWPGGASSGCGYDPNYAPPLLLRAGVPYVFRDVSCIYPECSGDPVGYYTIVINGRRPDPDGGTYAFSCVTWRTSNPTACQ
ncbi:MAG: hypothetical protein HOP12_07515 [Candidatus Eisenbacteria bacterium]|uniref:Uncharacterized protein n=1 Tax=Eiseniibacteriota bacterium TaxID=2212470 RepID=A0A849SHS0_UNCEI|nr:hypothetical protein [Candidatus Eisenbacteria bacterium]